MSKTLIGILIGTIATLGILAIGTYISIVNGLIPAGGDQHPGGLETWVAHKALQATLKRQGLEQSPIQADEASLMAGAKIYARDCAVCHGTPVNTEPDLAKGLHPDPTLFGKGDLVTDDPEGYTYWKIQHGIRFTGMPSFSNSLSTKEMWQVALFLKNMDKLPGPVDENWKSMK